MDLGLHAAEDRQRDLLLIPTARALLQALAPKLAILHLNVEALSLCFNKVKNLGYRATEAEPKWTVLNLSQAPALHRLLPISLNTPSLLSVSHSCLAYQLECSKIGYVFDSLGLKCLAASM